MAYGYNNGWNRKRMESEEEFEQEKFLSDRNEFSRTPIEVETRLYSLRICLREAVKEAGFKKVLNDPVELRRNFELQLQLKANIEAFEWMFNREEWIKREFSS